MKAPQDIILQPIITERSTMDAAEGRYAFYVAPGSTKPEIRHAVEALFEVKVLAVNTSNIDGKTKRVGVHVGKRPNRKKAIVKIDLDPKNETFLTEGGKASSGNKKYKTAIEDFGFMQ